MVSFVRWFGWRWWQTSHMWYQSYIHVCCSLCFYPPPPLKIKCNLPIFKGSNLRDSIPIVLFSSFLFDFNPFYSNQFLPFSPSLSLVLSINSHLNEPLSSTMKHDSLNVNLAEEFGQRALKRSMMWKNFPILEMGLGAYRRGLRERWRKPNWHQPWSTGLLSWWRSPSKVRLWSPIRGLESLGGLMIESDDSFLCVRYKWLFLKVDLSF